MESTSPTYSEYLRRASWSQRDAFSLVKARTSTGELLGFLDGSRDRVWMIPRFKF